MPRNIVICCDGTGNQIEANLSNVLKLYRILRREEGQLVFYHPGVGTLGNRDPWAKIKQQSRMIFGLATGAGLDDNLLETYRFLVNYYRPDDRVFLFGFSRGAYTARMLAGFLHMVGLLEPQQVNLAGYALTAYKQAAERSDFKIAWRFKQVAATRHVGIAFLGVWDTVASVIVPRPDRLYLPSLQTLPYTATNPSVAVMRHALAIDERRRMFRVNHWTDPQPHRRNPFDAQSETNQDIKQVWFSGVHSDVGGGYPEVESGSAKYPLKWMIDEAAKHGVHINEAMYRHLVEGASRAGGRNEYVPPSPTAPIHNSMNTGWKVAEVLPKRTRRREWPRPEFGGWYLPMQEPRRIADGANVHRSVIERCELDSHYRPENLPEKYVVVD